MKWALFVLVAVLAVDAQDSLVELFNVVGELAGSLSAGCTHTCPDGAAPMPKPRHKPTTNGCGSYGIKVDLANYPDMTSCCDSHDICYDTCGEDKSDCDQDFQRCLQKVCKKMKKKNIINDNQLKGCRSTVDLVYGGLLALGCDAYKTAQDSACTCPPMSQGPNTEL